MKPNGDAVPLRIKPDLLDGRVLADQPGHAGPRIAASLGGSRIRGTILHHTELFPAIADIISAALVIRCAFLADGPHNDRKK